MAAVRGPTAIVPRLEASIANAIRGRDRVSLAYSGGLASTLVAMIARKRCDLTCVVAGREGSADVVAGQSAKQHLDYRMETILLDGAFTTEIDRRLIADFPELTSAERRNLIPAHAVHEVAGDAPVLAGFVRPMRAAFVSALQDTKVMVPLRAAQEEGPIARAQFRSAAMQLGLPQSWADVRHRDPASGAGIEEFLP